MSNLLTGKKLTPEEDPTSVGNIAIQKGYTTREQVRVARNKQEARLPIGKILVEDTSLSEAQLEDVLIEQEMLRQEMTTKESLNYLVAKRQEKLHEVTEGFHALADSFRKVAGA